MPRPDFREVRDPATGKLLCRYCPAADALEFRRGSTGRRVVVPLAPVRTPATAGIARRPGRG